jgi:hypothetical protein
MLNFAMLYSYSQILKGANIATRLVIRSITDEEEKAWVNYMKHFFFINDAGYSEIQA